MYQFAIIGCGTIAHKHAEEINRIGELIAVCDIIPTKADQFAEKYDVKSYYSIEELLQNEENIDIVSVCTPNGYHAEHSIKSLQAGKDVICESPFCLTKAGVWQTIETEKFCRRKLFVINANSYNVKLKEMKELVSKKTFGQLQSFELKCTAPISEEYKDWRGKLFPGGGALYTAFSSYVGALISLFGEMDEARGTTEKLDHQDLEIEDAGTATLQMKSGITGHLQWSLNGEQPTSLSIRFENAIEKIWGEDLNQDAYSFFYDHLQSALQEQGGSLSNLYESARTVEAIEKIYKAVLPNPSSNN